MCVCFCVDNVHCSGRNIDSMAVHYCMCITYCNYHSSLVSLSQNRAQPKFQGGLPAERTNGGRTCHPHHPHHHHLHHLSSPSPTAVSHLGWIWPRENQWPGVTRTWTDRVKRNIERERESGRIPFLKSDKETTIQE